MEFFEVKSQKKGILEVTVKKALTFDSICSKNPYEDIKNNHHKGIHHITIDCSKMTEIDSCGLSLLSLITKNYPTNRVTVIKTNSKYEKLKALYINQQT